MRRNRMLAFHPKRNRILKAAWGLLLVLAMAPFGTPAYGSAGSANGNPFSNGTFWPSEGTFEAVMRGKNLTGVATFSTVGVGIEDIAASGGGIFSVFYNGITYVGNVNSAIDVNSGQIAATFEASIEGLAGEGSSIVDSELVMVSGTFEQGGTTVNSQDSIQTLVFDLPAGGTITSDGTVVNGPAVGELPIVVTQVTVDVTPNTVTQEFGFMDTVANFEYQDARYAAGSFLADLQDSYPNQAFYGKGTFSFSQLAFPSDGLPEVVTETVDFNVDGVRVADAVQTFTPFDITVPQVVVSFEVQRSGGSGGGTTSN